MLRPQSHSQLFKSASDGQQQHYRYQHLADGLGSGTSTPTTRSATPSHSGTQTPLLTSLFSHGSGTFGGSRHGGGSPPLLHKLGLAVGVTILIWLAALALLHSSMVGKRPTVQSAVDACSAQPAWFAEAKDEQQLLQADIGRLQAQIDHLEGLGGGATTNIMLDASSQSLGSVAAGDSSRSSSSTKPAPFLFVGVLSVSHTPDRRQAVRETWVAAAPSEVMARFVLYEEERNAATDAEAEEFGDIIYVRSGGDIDYRSIHRKVLAMVIWVAENINPNFVLKTDDDAYVDLERLVAELRSRCRHPDCRNERLYMGEEKRNGMVIIESGNKWSNVEYWEHTGLKEYMPYMYGGGYIFSGDIARALHLTNKITPLKNMPNEDATFGVWVSGMNLLHVAHPKIRTAAGQCCLFKLPEQDSLGRWRQHQLRFWEDMCAGWLVLHKVDSTGMMHYVHHRITASCPEERMLLDKAAQLAVAAGRVPSTMPPMQMYMISDWQAGHHFSGALAGTPWSPEDILLHIANGTNYQFTEPEPFFCSVRDADGRYVLSLRTSQGPHDVAPEEQVQIGVVDMTDGEPLTMTYTGWSWRLLDTSRAWNYRAGPHVQWLGNSSDLILFNDRGCKQQQQQQQEPAAAYSDTCAVVFSISQQRRLQELPRPIYSVSRDGRLGLSVDFVRLEAATPGWGYAAKSGSTSSSSESGSEKGNGESDGASAAALLFMAQETRCPGDDGLWLVNLQSGNQQLLVSYHELLQSVGHDGRFGGYKDEETDLPYAGQAPNLPSGVDWGEACLHSIDQPQFSQDGDAIAFRYRITNCTGESFPSWAGPEAGIHVYLFTINTDGSGLWRVPGVAPTSDSHLDYGASGQLLVCQPEAAYLVQHKESVTTLAKPKPLVHETLGSCRFAPGSTRHVVGETRGRDHAAHKLYVWDLQQKDVYIVGHLFDADWSGAYYHLGTLQPKWSHDGRYITYDSSAVWTTGMQMYAVAVQTLQVEVPVAAQQQLAAGSKQQRKDGAGGVQASAAANSVASSRRLQELPLRQGGQQHHHLIGKQQRQLVVDLSGGSMSGVKHLQQQGADLSTAEVHVFGAQLGKGAPQLAHKEQAAAAQLVLHAEEPVAEDVGSGDNSTAIDGIEGGSSSSEGAVQRDHTEVSALVPLLFGPRDGGGGYAMRHPWLLNLACRLSLQLLPACGSSSGSFGGAGGSAAAGQQDGDGAAADAEDGRETIDFSKWLQSNAGPEDMVVLALDLPTQQQLDILRSLLLDESLLLVDHLLVRWHVTATQWHMTHVWERILADLGISWEYIM